MNQQEETSAELKQLIDELTNVLNSMNKIAEEKQVICEETLNKLKKLNVDPEIVRQIMRRADELKGKTENFRTTESLYETFDKLKNVNR